jgi:hypothetical protein
LAARLSHQGSRFLPDLPGATAVQPLARQQGVGPVVLDKSRMHGFAGMALILFAIAGSPSAGARGRRALLAGNLACAILRWVLCHAGNDGGRKGRRR